MYTRESRWFASTENDGTRLAAQGIKGKLNETNLRLMKDRVEKLIMLKQGLPKYLLSKRWWLARAADAHFGAVKRLSWYYKQL